MQRDPHLMSFMLPSTINSMAACSTHHNFHSFDFFFFISSFKKKVMASAQELSHHAGETKATAQVKKDEMVDSASQTAQSAKDSTSQAAQSAKDSMSQAAQSTKESSLEAKDQAGGFLQQTGEQVKSMAQGAADAVKNTLGMGENNPTSKQ